MEVSRRLSAQSRAALAPWLSLGRNCAAPGKTGDFKKQDQDQQGERHHKDRDLRISLAGNIGRLGRGDAGKKRNR